jgi:branched-chain amino acid transport system substrate-binding protein
MKIASTVAYAALLFGCWLSPVAADTIKVGIIGPFSGSYALEGGNFKAGIEAYRAIYGKAAGGHEIEVIYRDLPAPNPQQARSLAQELVVRDHVQYLAGIYFTPDAMAVTPILKEANVPLVIFNAATSSIMEQSPYVLRTSFTPSQTIGPLGAAAVARGIKTAVTAVSDYGTGIDSESAFKKSFTAAGGKIIESIRMPLQTNDFSPIMQRLKDAHADAVFAFLPAGPTALSFVKSYNDNGLKASGMKILAGNDLMPETDLPILGDGALGLLTTFYYSRSHVSEENRKFVDVVSKLMHDPKELSAPAVAAFDGMHLVYKMVEATEGKQSAEKAVAAVKGYSWMSPRGRVSIDPKMRHITQTIYLREVTKESNGNLINKEIESFPDQIDSNSKQ